MKKILNSIGADGIVIILSWTGLVLSLALGPVVLTSDLREARAATVGRLRWNVDYTITNATTPDRDSVWVADENKELVELTITNATARNIQIDFPVDRGAIIFTNPPYVCVAKSSNLDTFASNFVAEIRQQNVVPQVIAKFAESGDICRVYGHHWTPGPFYAVVESYETCTVCKKVEMVQPPHSK